MGTLARQRFGWYMYDWANSAFSSTVVTVFLGPYITAVAERAAVDGTISPFGLIDLHPGSWYTFMASLSVILQVAVLPLVGTIVDASPFKRRLLGMMAFPGAFATTGLFMLSVEAGNYIAGGLLFVVANVFFGASIVVANAFLPYLAEPRDRDRVSSRGWALGYLGGGLLLLINLAMYQGAVDAGSGVDLTIRLCLASAGIWWCLFTIVPMTLLPKTTSVSEAKPLRQGFRQLWSTLLHMRRYPETLRFLTAYLLYNDAVQTVIVVAGLYATEELGLDQGTLTTAILMVQFVAMIGAVMFDYVARWFSAKTAILIALVMWTLVLFAAWSVVYTEGAFFVLAAVIGVVMGGTQALSRSLFSQMIPPGYEGEYFSFYEISDKGTSWLGTLVFGLVLTWTSSYRGAILSLLVFFVLGLLILRRVNVAKASSDARGEGMAISAP